MIAPDSLLLIRIFSGFVTMVEFKSFVENISKMTDRSIWSGIKDRAMEMFNLEL
jgi:hypothetical protein